MNNIGCINPEKGPHEYELVWFRRYDGSCDHCGADHDDWLDFPAVYLGEYRDGNGAEYRVYEVAVWLRCKGCGGFVQYIKTYYNGLLAERYDLFVRIKA